MESPFEESLETSFGTFLAKYISKQGIAPYAQKIIKRKLTKDDIKLYNKLYKYYEVRRRFI
jgi:hypothetical protein